MKPKLRIAIYGAGMIGNYLGGRLHGHASVRFIARPHMAATLSEHGLHVSDLYGYQQRIAPNQLDIRTRSDAAHAVDLLLVTVKSAATVDAAHELAEVLSPETLVISFQNGVRNTSELRAALPKHKVLTGMVPFNVTQPEPAHFHQGSSGELITERSDALTPFADTFASSGLPLQQHEDMQAVLWAKLLLNLNNPLNALSGLPLREQLAKREWRQCLALLQREGLRILDAAGIRPAHLSALPVRWVPSMLSMPDGLFRKIAGRMLAIDPFARSSMWDDLQAGRRTEVDYINGEIAALAASKGMQAPANARIVTLMRKAEQSYAPWDAQMLLKELRSAQ